SPLETTPFLSSSIHESLSYLEGRATVFHSRYLSAWAGTRAGEKPSVVLGHFVLPPACLQEEPMVKVYARPRAEGGKENILVCIVRGFSPEPLDIDLLKNGEPMPSVKYLSFGEKGQYLLYAPFSRTSGDTYSCRVEHSTMPEPRTYQW
ncbi:beta-2-microglobulin-like, partial [Malurus melanocephalus]|uniref:beta-2-microglobulin-like n=1 Tax=Malurus melanocephalus TaxID=175006 RepID=UPI0025479476